MCANMCSLEKQFPLFYFYIILYSSMSFYYIILLKLLLEILSSIKGGMGFVPPFILFSCNNFYRDSEVDSEQT